MRTLLVAIRIAFRAIARSKLRAALTVLGVLIGVAAVVIVVALGTGVRAPCRGDRVSGGQIYLHLPAVHPAIRGAAQ